jgi:hypothetical protein
MLGFQPSRVSVLEHLQNLEAGYHSELTIPSMQNLTLTSFMWEQAVVDVKVSQAGGLAAWAIRLNGILFCQDLATLQARSSTPVPTHQRL